MNECQVRTLGYRELPTNWRWARLGEVCRVVSGGTPSTHIPDFWDGDIPWVTPTDLGKQKGTTLIRTARQISSSGLESSSAEIVPIGTILMSSRAPIGHLAVAGIACCTNQGCKNLIPGEHVDSQFLYFALKKAVPELKALGSGATFAEVSKSIIEGYKIPLPPLPEQKRIAAILNEQIAAADRARVAADAQLEAAKALPVALIKESFNRGRKIKYRLDDCLIQITNGVGASWSKYQLLGATRAGLAPAKEVIGKKPERYKLVEEGTIFYNPMRILLGSIAIVDKGGAPGITSPDYVVFKTKEGLLHPRWFYYWLRSPYGDSFIKTLSRGAVRERMLFRRLATADVELPTWDQQLQVAEKMKHIQILETTIIENLNLINALPTSLLRRAFNGEM